MSIKFSISKVKEIMAEHPVLADPNSTIKEAAGKMKVVGCGCLPVGIGHDLEGIITDRDIIIRAIADGKDPKKTSIKPYMTKDVKFCYEDDTIESAAEKMQLYRVNRLVVKNKDEHVTGVLSFGHILKHDVRADDLADIVKSAAGPIGC